MITMAKTVFENQSTPDTFEIINSYGCESMTLQVEGSGSFQLIVSGRTNLHYEYQQMSAITDDFNVINAIAENGVFSYGCGGRGSIKIELISVTGSVNCQVNLF